MFHLVLLALAAAPPAEAATATGKPRLVVLDLTAGAVEPSVAQSLSEAVAVQASKSGLFDVTTQKDISTLLGLERQKQLLGCSEDSSSCLSELAGAIGARFVVSGSVTRLGDTFQLNLQTLDTVRAQTIGRSTRIARSLDELRGTIPFAFADASATPAPPQPSNLRSYLLGGVGAAAAVTSAVLFVMAYSREQISVSELQLAGEQPQLQLKTADYYRSEATSVLQMRLIAGGLLALGVAFGVAAVVLYRSPDSAPRSRSSRRRTAPRSPGCCHEAAGAPRAGLRRARLHLHRRLEAGPTSARRMRATPTSAPAAGRALSRASAWTPPRAGR